MCVRFNRKNKYVIKHHTKWRGHFELINGLKYSQITLSVPLPPINPNHYYNFPNPFSRVNMILRIYTRHQIPYCLCVCMCVSVCVRWVGGSDVYYANCYIICLNKHTWHNILLQLQQKWSTSYTGHLPNYYW